MPDMHGHPSEPPVVLYTPAQAAEVLTVKESWLRRKAGKRSIPCTFVGRHLRFSEQNLRDIASAGSRPPRQSSRYQTR